MFTAPVAVSQVLQQLFSNGKVMPDLQAGPLHFGLSVLEQDAEPHIAPSVQPLLCERLPLVMSGRYTR